jgi:ribonucleoside-diphosphate reductase alpha chain
MQAPTGTTALLSNSSSGIEPVYEFEFIRRDRLGKHVIRHHLYEQWYQKHKEGIENGTVKKPEWFASANDLTPEDHIKIQGVIQKYVDASISKTVNAPKTHTVEDVKKLYTLAYQLGLKGIAYMREGSRQGVLEREDSDKKNEQTTEKKQVPTIPEVKPRPMMVTGSTYQVQTPVGKAFITINTNGNNEPFEVFINVGKAGSDISAMAEALGRMISLNLRFGPHINTQQRVQEIIHHFSGIGGSGSVGFGKERVRSLPDAVSKVLTTHIALANSPSSNGVVQANGIVSPRHEASSHAPAAKDTNASPAQFLTTKASYDLCPECGIMALVYQEGCKKCFSCGYSAC